MKQKEELNKLNQLILSINHQFSSFNEINRKEDIELELKEQKKELGRVKDLFNELIGKQAKNIF